MGESVNEKLSAVSGQLSAWSLEPSADCRPFFYQTRGGASIARKADIVNQPHASDPAGEEGDGRPVAGLDRI